jgi:hypothetical protein
VSQGTDIQPESRALGTLIDFIIECFAEAVPVQQGVQAFGAGVLNIPEIVDPVGPFHVDQFGSRCRVAVLYFFDLAPIEPQTSATSCAGVHFNAGYFQRLEFIITCWAIHLTSERPIAPDCHRLPLTVSQYPLPAGSRTVHTLNCNRFQQRCQALTTLSLARRNIIPKRDYLSGVPKGPGLQVFFSTAQLPLAIFHPSLVLRKVNTSVPQWLNCLFI